MSNKNKKANSSGRKPRNESASHKFSRILALVLSALMCVGALTYIIFAIIGVL